MNEKEISEIRRRFRPEKSNISHVRGCYVNKNGEIISQFNQSLSLTPQEESENILSTMKKTLSGTYGKNLIDISFTTQQVVNSKEHQLLMSLKNSSLTDEDAVQELYQRIIESVDLDGSYMILLAFDTYDIPYRSKDGESFDDASSEVFSYFLCSICPVTMTKPTLSYYAADNMLHNRTCDWIISAPELGFLFPAFDDRSSNIYNALYYSRNISENHEKFIREIFNSEIPMPAAEQKETFHAILENTLAEDCSYEVLQAVHGQLAEIIEEHKTNRDELPLVISKSTVKNILTDCDVPELRVAAFEEQYDSEFGSDANLNPRNIIDNRFEVCTPDVTIHVKPERSGLLKTQVINGTKYILIRADEHVEVNGVAIHITE